MHYVIGDVHGCYKELMAMIETIEARDDDALFYFVGDFVDRGPETKKVLDWCIEHVKKDGKFQSVLGNHEDMILDWYHHQYLPYSLLRKSETDLHIPHTHYDFAYVIKENDLDDEQKLKPYMDWMESLPLYIDLCINDKQYRIVHAWSDFKEDSKFVCVWTRNIKGNFENDVTIIHGHTPTITHYYEGDSQGKICYRHNSINVDGGCVFGKMFLEYKCNLCGLCLETMEEIYIPVEFENFIEKEDI